MLSASFRLSLGCSFWISSKLLWSIDGWGGDSCFFEALLAFFFLPSTAVRPSEEGRGVAAMAAKDLREGSGVGAGPLDQGRG